MYQEIIRVFDKQGNEVAKFDGEDPQEELRKFCLNQGWGEGHVDNLLEELDLSGESYVYNNFDFTAGRDPAPKQVMK